MKFIVCDNCGSNLDYGEKCGCAQKEKATSAGTLVASGSDIIKKDNTSVQVNYTFAR